MDAEIIEKVATRLVVPFTDILTTHPTGAVSSGLVGWDSSSSPRGAPSHALINDLASGIAGRLEEGETNREEEDVFISCARALEEPLTACLSDGSANLDLEGSSDMRNRVASSPFDSRSQWSEFCPLFQNFQLGKIPLAEIPPCCWNDPLLRQYLLPSAHNASQSKKVAGMMDGAKKHTKRALCERLLVDGVSPKKRYEVVRAACYIHHKAQRVVEELALSKTPPSSTPRVVLIDVGAGQGYLSAFLAVSFGYDVVALERDDNQVHGSTKRSVALSLVQSAGGVFREEEEEEAEPADTPQPSTKSECEHHRYGHASSRMGCVAVCHASVDSGTQWEDVQAKVLHAIAGEDLKHNRKEKTAAASDGEAIVFVMYSLHACGPLSSNMIRLFSEWKSCVLLVNVGCCYNMLADERADTQISVWAGGGPMSEKGKRLLFGEGNFLSSSQEVRELRPTNSVVEERDELWGKTAFMAACQAPHRWLECAAVPDVKDAKGRSTANRKRTRNAVQSSDVQGADKADCCCYSSCSSSKETAKSDVNVGICELAEAIHSNFDRTIFQSFLDESVSFSFSPLRHGKLWTKARLAVQRANIDDLTSCYSPSSENGAPVEDKKRDTILQLRFAHAVARTYAAYCELEGVEPPKDADLSLIFRRAQEEYKNAVAKNMHLYFSAYWICRALVGHAMERFILEDRLCFLRERQQSSNEDTNRTIRGANLERLFDISASPRCVAVVAWR